MRNRAAFAITLSGLAIAASFGQDAGSQPDAATMERARDIARQYYREEPVPAARGLSIKLWGLLAEAGDQSSVNRLYAIATSKGEKDFNAARALLRADDDRILNHWDRLISDRTKTLQDRSRGFFRTSSFLPEIDEPYPPSYEQLALEILAAIETGQIEPTLRRSAINTLAVVPPTDARIDLLDRFIRRSINDATRQGNRNSQSALACTVQTAVKAIGKCPNNEVLDTLDWVVVSSPWSSVRSTAVGALARADRKLEAMELLRKTHDSIEQSRADELRDVHTLAVMGDDSARRKIVNAMYHPDDNIRAMAYSALCRLGDESFLDVAVNDYNEYDEHVGFAWLGGQGFLKSGPGRDLQARYMYALAESAHDPMERAIALDLLSEAGLLIDEILALTRPVLDEPIIALPANEERDYEREAKWHEQIARHKVLLRDGTKAEKARALDRLIEAFECAEISQFTVVVALGRSQYRGAQPFLRERMFAYHDVDNAIIQLFAAIGYFAIEVDRIPG